MSKPNLKVADMGEGLVMFRIEGLFEGNEAGEYKQPMLDAVAKTKAKTLWLDLSEINYVDSAALAVMITVAKAAADRHIQFCIYKPTDNVLKVLEVVSLDKIIPIVG